MSAKRFTKFYKFMKDGKHREILVLVASLLFSVFLDGVLNTASSATVTWTGASPSWNEPTNWDPNAVPGTTDDVVIPGNVTYSPILNIVETTINSLTISGGNLNLNGNNLLITGNLTINNNGTLEASTGAPTITVDGNWDSSNGTFDYGQESTVELTGSCSNTNETILKTQPCGSCLIPTRFSNLTILGEITSKEKFKTEKDLTISGVLKIEANAGVDYSGNLIINAGGVLSGNSNFYRLADKTTPHIINNGKIILTNWFAYKLIREYPDTSAIVRVTVTDYSDAILYIINADGNIPTTGVLGCLDGVCSDETLKVRRLYLAANTTLTNTDSNVNAVITETVTIQNNSTLNVGTATWTRSGNLINYGLLVGNIIDSPPASLTIGTYSSTKSYPLIAVWNISPDTLNSYNSTGWDSIAQRYSLIQTGCDNLNGIAYMREITELMNKELPFLCYKSVGTTIDGSNNCLFDYCNNVLIYSAQNNECYANQTNSDINDAFTVWITNNLNPANYPADSDFDGIELDDFFYNLSQFNNVKGIADYDKDENRTPDSAKLVDEKWREGLINIVQTVRNDTQVGNKLLIANCIPEEDYTRICEFAYKNAGGDMLLNGVLTEDHLKKDLLDFGADISNTTEEKRQRADNLLDMALKWTTNDRYFIFVEWNAWDIWNATAEAEQQKRRFYVYFASMANAYLATGADHVEEINAQKWLNPPSEYQIILGKPLETVQKIDKTPTDGIVDYWKRIFEYGTVYLNPYNLATTIDINNDGVVDTLPAYDGTLCVISYRDADGDGYGDINNPSSGCIQPSGYVLDNKDCNDNDPTIHPNVDDSQCDGIDNNCNNNIDEGYVPTATSCGVGACTATGQNICQNGQIIDTCTPDTPTTIEGPFGNATCSDSFDNDCDGLTDSSDSDCFPPDLIISSLLAPHNVNPGQLIDIYETTTNLGNGNSETTTTRFYLSRDNTYSVNDIFLGHREVPPLAPGNQNSAVTQVLIPSQTTTGSYFIIAIADANRLVIESNEINNIKARLINIQ